MLRDELASFLHQQLPSHMAGLYRSDIETHLRFSDQEIRLAGTYDRDYYPSFGTLQLVGVSGWNYIDQRTYSVNLDFDAIVGHVAGHTATTLDALIAAMMPIEEIELRRSKGGKGFHGTIYFDPENAPVARSREQHIANAHRALAWLSEQCGIDLSAAVDCVGVLAWIWAATLGPNAFQLIKQSTAFLDRDIVETLTIREEQPDCESLVSPFSSAHQPLIDWLLAKGAADWDGRRLNTHTAALAQAHEALKLKGDFETNATGREGASDRNCFAYPGESGSWFVYRHGKAKEHSSWRTSRGGWTFCTLNPAKRTQGPAATIVKLAEADELFHDRDGAAFVTATICGTRETLAINEAPYRHSLRLRYTEQTGDIIKADTLKNALSQLEAIACQQRPQYDVAVRVAAYDGKLYIDLADKQRRIIEVDEHGYREAQSPPVRFRRPFGMLPLPFPQQGGTLADLKPFANVDDEDWPLLLTFVVAAFHPDGPYSLLELIGEQGSAKTSLARFLHQIIDPHIAPCAELPKDPKDLLVSAQQKRLLSFDNLDALDRKTSSRLCCLATGSAMASRKLFSDADQSILRAKAPIILTAIRRVVTANDLADRTISLTLPTIAPDERRSEYAIAEELRKPGVLGKLFGYVLSGVSAALAGHANVGRTLPRMADAFSWGEAAAETLGIGSPIDAFEAAQQEPVLENPYAAKLQALCEKGFTGQAKDLAEKLGPLLSAREAGDTLRELAPELRKLGYFIDHKKTKGKVIITLCKQSTKPDADNNPDAEAKAA